MNDDSDISFSKGEINLITSLLTHAYLSWLKMLEDDSYPEDHTREDCEDLVEIILETLRKFSIINESISGDDEDDEDSYDEDFPNNVINFPIKK